MHCRDAGGSMRRETAVGHGPVTGRDLAFQIRGTFGTEIPLSRGGVLFPWNNSKPP